MQSAYIFFLFNHAAPSEIYTLSLHDALPISRDHRARDPRRASAHGASRHPHRVSRGREERRQGRAGRMSRILLLLEQDRKSTRLNSSHVEISYAVFCLKKKKLNKITSDITCL